MKENKKVYFVTGGATGGHIYPALAIAKTLKTDNDTKNVFFVGCKNKPEFNLAKENNIPFLQVKVSSMPRKASLKFLFWMIQLGFAVLQSLLYLFKEKPNAVFGTGGYVSSPMLIACTLMKVPFMIHDGDAVPGLVSRKIASRAKCVSCTFEQAKNFLNNKNIHVLGNPIRESFSTTTKVRALNVLGLQEKFTLFITGGSQGAKNLNNTVIELYKELIEKYNIQIIHQTGEKNYKECIANLEKIYPEYKDNTGIIIQPYFSDNAIPMKAADLAISRAGSLSISELHASNLPAILVPYPYAAANHQLKNALEAQNMQTAICVEENDLFKENLSKILNHLLSTQNSLDIMIEATKKSAKLNSAKEICTHLKAIANE